MNPTGDLISRRQLLEELEISDSSEWRKRKEGGHEWPPHLCIGRKIYYRRSAVDDWLRRQEALCQPADHATIAAICRCAKEIADSGGPLNPPAEPPREVLLRAPGGGGRK